MIGRREFGLMGLSTAAMLAMNRTLPAQDDDHARHGDDSMLEECAEECDECARECDACSLHCAEMIAEGKKDHLETLRTCQDCAQVCSAAARIVARNGPFSGDICTACAEVCAKCAESCERFKDDKIMRECAEACRECEKACREMLKHISQAATSR